MLLRSVGSVHLRAMARNKNPNPYLRGKKFSAGKRSRLHPQDAADIARDTIANDWNWQMVKANYTAAEQGLLDRAARTLGIT